MRIRRFSNGCPTRNGGRLVLRRVWENGRIGGTRMSSRHRKSRLRLSLSRGVVGGDVKCTERPLQDVTNCRFAQPASSATGNRLSRVWVRRARSDSSYALHRQSRRREKGAVSQLLRRRFFRRLLLIFVPPICLFTIPTAGHLSLGSPQCIVCPKMCCENRGQIWKVALFSAGAIEHWEHNRALSEQ